MNKSIPFLFFVIFTGCSDNPTEIIDRHELSMDCDPSEFDIVNFTYCDDTITYKSPEFLSEYCDYINKGDVSLLPETRYFSKYMCSIMQSVLFKNQNDELTSFNVNSFASTYATHDSRFNEPCPDDPVKMIYICSQNEEATAILKNNNIGIEFNINLEVYSRDSENPKNNSDQLIIYIKFTDEFGAYYATILSFLINTGEINKSPYSKLHYEDQLKINGEIFNEVYFSYPLGDASDVITEIYFTKQLGIVAFREKNGALWSFEKFN